MAAAVTTAGGGVLRRRKSESEQDEAYDAHVGELARGRLRVACAVLLVVLTLDGAYERFARPSAFQGTFWTRLAIAALCALVLLLVRAPRSARALRLAAVLVVAGVAVDVESAILATGGDKSVFFAGLVLLVVSAGLLFPFDLKTTLVAAGLVWGVFLAPVALGWLPVVRALLADQAFFMVCATLVAAVGSHVVDRLRRREFDGREALRAEKDLSERLLLNVLPPAIAERLKSGEATIADRFSDAAILFADIVGFTPLSARMDPAELVQVLDEIFTAFDQAAVRHGLEKIKTIGDAYMVAAGVPAERPDYVEAIADMALDMRQAVAAIRDARKIPLEVRIGIHAGPVVAGVIGTSKFTYDVWGDTVNVASRMESHGKPGQIQVSDSVGQALEAKYELSEPRSVEVKGKGAVETRFLLGRH